MNKVSVVDATIHQLIEALFLPLFSQKDERGVRTYVRFLQFLIRMNDIVHIRASVAKTAPITNLILNVIRSKLPILKDDLWTTRRILLNRFAVDAIADFDRKVIVTEMTDQDYFKEIVNLTAQAFRTV